MDKTTIDTYNELAKDYDAETADFWLHFPNAIITQFVEKVDGNKKVLNIGSGPGSDGLLLQERGLKITCLDASSEMVKLCKNKELDAVEGDLLSLPFQDNTFDGVWAYTSLLHVRKKDIDKAMSEIRRVLKEDGFLGLGMIEGEGESYREKSRIGKLRWFAFYTKEEIENLLRKHDFNIEYFEEFTPGSKKYLNYISRKITIQ